MVIKSKVFWVKVVDFLRMNWALIDSNKDGTCTVYFLGDTGGVFDAIHFPSIDEATNGLLRNRFFIFDDSEEAKEILTPPRPPFEWRDHPAGRIYSSGRFWH